MTLTKLLQFLKGNAVLRVTLGETYFGNWDEKNKIK